MATTPGKSKTWLLRSYRRNSCQECLTVCSFLNTMHHYILRLFHRFQCVPFVPSLTASLLPTSLAQTARRRLLQPIAWRRLTATATVLGQLIFQVSGSRHRGEPEQPNQAEQLSGVKERCPISKPCAKSRRSDDGHGKRTAIAPERSLVVLPCPKPSVAGKAPSVPARLTLTPSSNHRHTCSSSALPPA